MSDFLSSIYSRTDRIYFNRWQEDNFQDALQLWGNESVTRLIGGPFSEEKIQKRFQNEIASYQQYQVQYWPFYSVDENKLIGCCGLRPYHQGEEGKKVFELGFHLLPQYWSKGLAREAADTVIRFAFTPVEDAGLGADALFAGHHPSNESSKRLLVDKLGFQYSHQGFYEPTGLYNPCYFLYRS